MSPQEYRKTAERVERHPWKLLKAAEYLRDLVQRNQEKPANTQLPTIDVFKFHTPDVAPLLPGVFADWYSYAPGTPKLVQVQEAPQGPKRRRIRLKTPDPAHQQQQQQQQQRQQRQQPQAKARVAAIPGRLGCPKCRYSTKGCIRCRRWAAAAAAAEGQEPPAAAAAAAAEPPAPAAAEAEPPVAAEAAAAAEPPAVASAVQEPPAAAEAAAAAESPAAVGASTGGQSEEGNIGCQVRCGHPLLFMRKATTVVRKHTNKLGKTGSHGSYLDENPCTLLFVRNKNTENS